MTPDAEDRRGRAELVQKTLGGFHSGRFFRIFGILARSFLKAPQNIREMWVFEIVFYVATCFLAAHALHRLKGIAALGDFSNDLERYKDVAEALEIDLDHQTLCNLQVFLCLTPYPLFISSVFFAQLVLFPTAMSQKPFRVYYVQKIGDQEVAALEYIAAHILECFIRKGVFPFFAVIYLLLVARYGVFSEIFARSSYHLLFFVASSAQSCFLLFLLSSFFFVCPMRRVFRWFLGASVFLLLLLAPFLSVFWKYCELSPFSRECAEYLEDPLVAAAGGSAVEHLKHVRGTLTRAFSVFEKVERLGFPLWFFERSFALAPHGLLTRWGLYKRHLPYSSNLSVLAVCTLPAVIQSAKNTRAKIPPELALNKHQLSDLMLKYLAEYSGAAAIPSLFRLGKSQAHEVCSAEKLIREPITGWSIFQSFAVPVAIPSALLLFAFLYEYRVLSKR